ncbi:MAG: transcriptional repressor [Gammaproteobacteria bacterium]|nr:transcriptional repressor [Gammaproteobacteria bacterium]
MPEYSNSSEVSVPEMLARFGIAPTSQRLRIGEILLTEKQHLSADQIIAKLREVGASVSKATVYNTLGLFARRGLVREIIVDPTRIFYDSNTVDHHHFYDVDNGVLLDIDTEGLRLAGLPTPPEGTTLDGVDVIVRIRRNPAAHAAIT